MKAFVFSLFVLFSVHSVAGQDGACDETSTLVSPECIRELGLEDQLSHIETELQNASSDAGITCPPVHLVRDVDRCEDKPACVLMVPQLEGTIVVNKPTLYVGLAFVQESSQNKLRHVAYHEACHIKNGDIGKTATNESDEAIQMRAEQCVFDLVGEDHYISFAKEWIGGSLNDDQLRQAVRGVFGKKE